MNHVFQSLRSKLAKAASNIARDFSEMEIRAFKTYRNSPVSAFNEEMYILTQKVEFLTKKVMDQQESIGQLADYTGYLESQLLRNHVNIAKATGRTIRSPQHFIQARKEVITAQAQVAVSIDLVASFNPNPSYRKEVNGTKLAKYRIHWNDSEWTPVTIAFNEFEIARNRDKEFDLTPNYVKEHWLTVYQQCGSIMGMTLSRLMKAYWTWLEREHGIVNSERR